MKRLWPDVSMLWDGLTPTADITVDGVTLTGHPLDVEAMFDAINALRDRAQGAERRLDEVRAALARIRP